MIKVYFTDKREIATWHVASFDNEDTYNRCFQSLDKLAKECEATIFAAIEE